MSCSNFSSTFSVSRTRSGPSASAPSSTRARAQSTVSEMEGTLRSSRPLRLWTKATSSRRSRASTSGTRLATIFSSRCASGSGMCRCRQRRFRASPRSRTLLEVRKTSGGIRALITPISGTETWKAESTSSRKASKASSLLSTSSMSSTAPPSWRRAFSSGRGSRNGSEKKRSPMPCNRSMAASMVVAPARLSPIRSFRIWV